ncbi:hypothetical protein GN244_ATG12775 [Phytophthora infestans]|uniref:Uncharacterized protein n=1 Tax=Phytophthora infestans TaxID=4787 RepID=A0A833SYG0_PHYIN|nr:hypothetical protein GN244_ATG12775 [Phytophthora infestans]KAF4135168.1 hypothetical protein GN958_ATG15662 [Phytophthora infestans]
MEPVTRAAARRAEEARRQSDANNVADTVEASGAMGIAQDVTVDEAQRVTVRATDEEVNNGDGETAGTEINGGAAQKLPVTGTVSEPEAVRTRRRGSTKEREVADRSERPVRESPLNIRKTEEKTTTVSARDGKRRR